jgi:hypothetical protein
MSGTKHDDRYRKTRSAPCATAILSNGLASIILPPTASANMAQALVTKIATAAQRRDHILGPANAPKA